MKTPKSIILAIYMASAAFPGHLIAQQTLPFDWQLLLQKGSYNQWYWPNWNQKYVYKKVNDSMVKLEIVKKKVTTINAFLMDSKNRLKQTSHDLGGETKLELNYDWDYRQGLPISRKGSDGTWEYYTDHNPQGKARTIQRSDSVFMPFEENLVYDDYGRIRQRTSHQLWNGKVLKSIEVLTYNSRGDVNRIERQSDPPIPYPIPVSGGLDQYAVEIYEYRYDRSGFWKKKYRLVNGKRQLIEKRIF